MSRTEIWLTGLGVVGAMAGALAAALFWLVVTQPLALAQILGGIR